MRGIVTGKCGGSGIGLGAALALAREGCRVAISGRSMEKLQRAAATFQGQPAILPDPCDVAVRRDVDRLAAWAIEQLGRLDVYPRARQRHRAGGQLEREERGAPSRLRR